MLLPLLHLAIGSCSVLVLKSRLVDEQVWTRCSQVQKACIRDAAFFAKLGDGLPGDLPELCRSDISAKAFHDHFDIELRGAHEPIEPQFK